ncbi:MFS transporter [uncultured Phenylobacterium sp.]|uniref:MFS transporter n=1 Tax=uncultured Phenylobacterium sp. TaxID=349273 RepID=UPI0025D65DA3|nr:MFS transporter [uncultured Phenylobacterium sp.]
MPARLDRLPWSRFHWLVVAALGITWILDGLEVTLVGALSPAIAGPDGLGLTATQVGLSGSAYILGAVLGAVLFGRLTDHFGRRKLFTWTIGIYLLATIATGFSWDFWSFLLFRFITGAGIGGEYGAVNSAIQELIPARRRGYTDLAINGSFWLGAALGAMGSLVVLNPAVIDQTLGWRVAFVIGGLLAIVIIWLRRFIPESPRWLMTHGRVAEAEAVVAAIEADVARRSGQPVPPHHDLGAIRLRPMRTNWTDIARTLFVAYPRRTGLCIVLMATQAFCYNAIFFTYAMMLTRFYAIEAAAIGWFLLPFAAGNFLGPLLLGPLFDSVGRRAMIALTYGVAGVLLCLSGWAFAQGWLTATTQTAAWTVIFFFASAGASAAYLTIGESFPLEIRAVSISLFYAFGTLVGGVGGPALFGALIDTGEPHRVMWGYLLGGGVMVVAAVLARLYGLAAERRPLEDVAPPLSKLDDAP